MIPFRTCLVTILCLSGFAAHSAPGAAAYAALPVGTRPRLSPDGRAIVMIGNDAGRPAFVVVHLGGSAPKVFSAGGWTPESATWKTNDIFLGDVRTTWHRTADLAQENTRLLVLHADGSRVMPIDLETADAGVRTIPLNGSAIAAILPNDPDHILMHTVDGGGPAISRIDLRDGSRALVQGRRGQHQTWFVDPEGVVRATETESAPTMMRRNVALTLLARKSAEDHWHEITHDIVDGKLGHQLAGFSPTDPDLLDILTNGPSGNTIIQAWHITSGAPGEVLAQSASHDVSAVRHDDELIGFDDGKAEGTPSYFDPAWQRDADIIHRALGRGRVDLIDRTADGKRVLASVQQGAAPMEYWLLDRSGGKTSLQSVIHAYEAIGPDDVASVRWITYSARDGLSIPALLTLPRDAPAGPLPFVVLPHGGPTAHDRLGFDWLAQFIASRGYGVLQPQFRGSTGFGAALRDAGLRNWGLSMQDDITDGARYLLAQHLAAPGRLCIVGASYGGYAALEEVEKEPGLFRCAAAFAPVTDLSGIVSRGDFANRDLNLPLPDADSATLARVSPVNGVDRIRVPILLVHGEQDFTVQVAQSRQMEYALKRAGKSVRAVYLPDSDHYLANQADRLALLQAMEPFLATNLR